MEEGTHIDTLHFVFDGRNNTQPLTFAPVPGAASAKLNGKTLIPFDDFYYQGNLITVRPEKLVSGMAYTIITEYHK